ncbi:hypothetical protein CJD36_010620 [Flavipsychrobacter stenotrophus]|uniref:ADP-heptose--LPS heptosyltransferase n=1 Tax=Flavipsychrobacter stenotrophus TaxID=2077091 RepID=A0A2S7SU46_9BACT|nr:lipopolysaccharide heptosyltransferase family protein [Flavipsychrobacter stenotrophus]PQJ10423.1 hypothetical protein CJD36_010620 [Flavipsychrobacter stenotrophus]
MAAIKKILLIQLMSNGDCLYATAVARQIKQDFPGCHLTWAIASFCKGILDNNPYVDAILEVPDVNRNTATGIMRQLRKDAEEKKRQGVYDEVFFTQIIDTNMANYDGSIRSSIFRGYDRPITVSVTPSLRLRDEEINKAKAFAERYKLDQYKNVILFEFAPQSGQLAMTPALALEMAGKIISNESTAIVLSSAIKIGDQYEHILDGSTLTLRETAALTHYCTMLLGCSSGITWISTSDAAKQLPMIQILDPDAFWVNPISRDFERFGFSTDTLIELYENKVEKTTACVTEALTIGFEQTRKKYYTPLPVQFKTTSRTIYNLAVFLQFGAIFKHIGISLSVFGWQPALIKEIVMGFVTIPFKLVYNVVSKRLKKK